MDTADAFYAELLDDDDDNHKQEQEEESFLSETEEVVDVHTTEQQQHLSSGLDLMFGLSGRGRNWRSALKLLNNIGGTHRAYAQLFAYFLKDECPPELEWISQVHQLVALARKNDAHAFRALGFVFLGRFAYRRYTFFNPRLAQSCFARAMALSGVRACEDLCYQREVDRAPMKFNGSDASIVPLLEWLREQDLLREEEIDGDDKQRKRKRVAGGDVTGERVTKRRRALDNV